MVMVMSTTAEDTDRTRELKLAAETEASGFGIRDGPHGWLGMVHGGDALEMVPPFQRAGCHVGAQRSEENRLRMCSVCMSMLG